MTMRIVDGERLCQVSDLGVGLSDRRLGRRDIDFETIILGYTRQ
jgi:hypothetical protein